MRRAVELAQELPVFSANVVDDLLPGVLEAVSVVRGSPHLEANIEIVHEIGPVGPPQEEVAVIVLGPGSIGITLAQVLG